MAVLAIFCAFSASIYFSGYIDDRVFIDIYIGYERIKNLFEKVMAILFLLFCKVALFAYKLPDMGAGTIVIVPFFYLLLGLLIGLWLIWLSRDCSDRLLKTLTALFSLVFVLPTIYFTVVILIEGLPEC